MPCTLEPWEVEYEEREANLKIFEKRVGHLRLLTEIACQLCRRIIEIQGVGALPPLAAKWWALHQAEDLKRAGPKDHPDTHLKT